VVVTGVTAPGGRRLRDRRGQLALIAADLFRRHGYHNVGVGDIAAAAGITASAVYRHFPSKQAILGHVVLSGVDSFVSVITAALDGSDTHDPPEISDAQRLAVLATSVSRLVVGRRELGALWRREGRNLPTADRAELAVRIRRATRDGVRLIRGVRPSLSTADADLLYWAALSVWGSISDHHVTLPKARFEALLTELALAVVYSDAVPAPSPAPRAAVTPQLPAQSRREQLLNLAARMFCEHGFHAVTMEDIGAAVGTSGPAVYRHYASKADLLLAMCGRVGDRLRAGVQAALRHPPPLAMQEMVGSFVHTVLEHRDLVAAYLTEGHNLPERDRAELRRLQRHYLDQWVGVLVAIDPTMDQKVARVRVHAAFTVVNDLARTGRFAGRWHRADELIGLANAVLVPTPAADEHRPAGN